VGGGDSGCFVCREGEGKKIPPKSPYNKRRTVSADFNLHKFSYILVKIIAGAEVRSCSVGAERRKCKEARRRWRGRTARQRLYTGKTEGYFPGMVAREVSLPSVCLSARTGMHRWTNL
jgi:hypothetical protein